MKEICIGIALGLCAGGLWKMHHWNEQRKVRAFYDLLEKGRIIKFFLPFSGSFMNFDVNNDFRSVALFIRRIMRCEANFCFDYSSPSLHFFVPCYNVMIIIGIICHFCYYAISTSPGKGSIVA